MTAEELLKLIREARKWGWEKIYEVFEGNGVYGYLEKYGVDAFVEKMNEAERLTIKDLKLQMAI